MYYNNQRNYQTLFQCTDCNFTSQSNEILTKHIAQAHSPTQFPCDLCNYPAHSQSDLDRHCNTMHKKNLKCRRCEKEFSDMDYLKEHLREEHRPSRTFYAKHRPITITSKPFTDNSNQMTAAHINSHVVQSSNSTSPKGDNCGGNCNASISTFNHKDEYDLHIQFYHEVQH